jgi:hypothetical protein
VADFFAAVVDFFFEDVAGFFEVDFAAAVLEALFVFVAGAGWVVSAPEAFWPASSLLFPSAGITARSAHRTAANTRAGMVADREEETNRIFPM